MAAINKKIRTYQPKMIRLCDWPFETSHNFLFYSLEINFGRQFIVIHCYKNQPLTKHVSDCWRGPKEIAKMTISDHKHHLSYYKEIVIAACPIFQSS